MKNYNDWEQKAAEALNSLDGIQRAAANPFLYTRIMARLEYQQNSWSKVVNFIGRPAIAISATIIFISINVAAILQNQKVQPLGKSASNETELAFESEFATVNYSLVEANNNDK